MAGELVKIEMNMFIVQLYIVNYVLKMSIYVKFVKMTLSWRTINVNVWITWKVLVMKKVMMRSLKNSRKSLERPMTILLSNKGENKYS